MIFCGIASFKYGFKHKPSLTQAKISVYAVDRGYLFFTTEAPTEYRIFMHKEGAFDKVQAHLETTNTRGDKSLITAITFCKKQLTPIFLNR